MSKHTPGPWFVGEILGMVGAEPNQTGQEYICDLYDTSYDIGREWKEINQGDDGNGMIKANARLISAAPDLLEALRELLDHVNAHCVTEGDCNQAKAAIAKAEE
jgi:hypothetical protein